MTKKVVVTLSEAERARLHTLVGSGQAPARTLTHARILLKSNQGEGGPGWTDAAIAAALEVHPTTVARVRQQCAAAGVEAALTRKTPDREYRRARRRAGGAPHRAGLQRAAARAHTLDRAPAGRAPGGPGGGRDGLPRDGAAGLQANVLKPHLKEQWCIPPAANPDFVYHMEDVLAVYTRPYDPRRPQVCLDETSRQLLGDVAPPLPAAPGHPAREDYEYTREGVCNLFMLCATRKRVPRRGWRHVVVSDRRTRLDFAHAIRELADVHYPDAERIVLVLDNLNTHSPASLYEAFAPAEARRLTDKLEIHYTPKHGSWLNMAEIELHVLAGQCLDRRLPDRATLTAEVTAWQADRNAATTPINWRFTTADARIKLKHLYPALDA